MRISQSTTILAFSSLAFLMLSQNNGVEARLTAEERLAAELKYPDNPNYCPPCLQKAMINHFPHACPKNLDPIEGTDRPNGPRPEEQRCVCIAFLDLYWMKEDCERECGYVNDPEAMKNFTPASELPGCDRWIDFTTGEEKEVEGFAKRDPNYKRKVYDDEEEVKSDKKVEEEQIEAVEVEAEFEAEVGGEYDGDLDPIENIDMDEIVEEYEDAVAEEVEEEERVEGVSANEIVAEEIAAAEDTAAVNEAIAEVEVSDEESIAEEVIAEEETRAAVGKDEL